MHAKFLVELKCNTFKSGTSFLLLITHGLLLISNLIMIIFINGSLIIDMSLCVLSYMKQDTLLCVAIKNRIIIRKVQSHVYVITL